MATPQEELQERINALILPPEEEDADDYDQNIRNQVAAGEITWEVAALSGVFPPEKIPTRREGYSIEQINRLIFEVIEEAKENIPERYIPGIYPDRFFKPEPFSRDEVAKLLLNRDSSLFTIATSIGLSSDEQVLRKVVEEHNEWIRNFPDAITNKLKLSAIVDGLQTAEAERTGSTGMTLALGKAITDPENINTDKRLLPTADEWINSVDFDDWRDAALLLRSQYQAEGVVPGEDPVEGLFLPAPQNFSKTVFQVTQNYKLEDIQAGETIVPTGSWV